MKSKLKIDLHNLSNKGIDFSYSQDSTELTNKLKPLIGDNRYNIKAQIRKNGYSSYIISGKIQTQLNLLCSRCAYEFKEPVNKEFEEKIFLQKRRTRIDKPVRNNHFSELMNREDFTVIDSSTFDLGEFLHEMIAIEEPLRPLGGGKTCDEEHFACEHLEEMKNKMKEKGLNFSQDHKTLKEI